MPDGRIKLGECTVGELDMSLSTRLFGNEMFPANEFMPAYVHTNKLIYVLAHEWGHGSDRRSKEVAKRQKRSCSAGFPPQCKEDSRELFAEAFAEWHLSRGRTDSDAAWWYAAQNGWRSRW